MILVIVSILEAVLYDFHWRVNKLVIEGISNLPKKVISYIQSKKIDELEKYITSARKHNLFDKDIDFYDDMQQLRKLRNRFHIQNTKNHFEADESVAFSETRLLLAENVLEKTLKVMTQKYSRTYAHVVDFELPWGAHEG